MDHDYKLSYPKESVDCSQCPMASQGIYKPHLKCCTYHPFLANFKVGAILKNADLGAKTILQKIERKEFVVPLGLLPPWSYRIEHKFKKGDEFGKRDDLLCPYFDKLKLNCQIWHYRSSQCCSFFCQSTDREFGLQSWVEIGELTNHIELAVSQHFLIHMGYDWKEVAEQVDLQMASEIHLQPLAVLPEKIHRQIWQHYFGKEIEFFTKASEYFAAMDREDLVELLDSPYKKNLIERWKLLN